MGLNDMVPSDGKIIATEHASRAATIMFLLGDETQEQKDGADEYKVEAESGAFSNIVHGRNAAFAHFLALAIAAFKGEVPPTLPEGDRWGGMAFEIAMDSDPGAHTVPNAAPYPGEPDSDDETWTEAISMTIYNGKNRYRFNHPD